MEGLLIHEQLVKLAPLLPSERKSWRFPDPHTFVLPLERGGVWLYNKPPNPRLAVEAVVPPPGGTCTGFQDLLVARAAGTLLQVRQVKLDRVVMLDFGAASGFVDTDPVTLIAELTGRNCNLVLVDTDGTILGVAREVTKDINRFRQLRSGLPYEGPPPYEKLDPRSASDEEIREALAGRALKRVNQLLDGFGPDLTLTLARLAGLPPERKLSAEDTGALLPALRELVACPGDAMRSVLALPDIDVLRHKEERAAKLQRLRDAFDRQKTLLEKRLQDIDRVREAAREAQALRTQADILMAYAHQVPAKAKGVTLPDFEGGTVEIQLDPQLDAIGNAQALYERVKKRENRSQQAESRTDELLAQLQEVEGRLASLEALSDEALDELVETHASQPTTQVRSEPGIRYTGPHGFRVLVGRNSRENDIVTFRLARSRDVWLHAQGYPGSHVVVQAENREVPFETILFAAQLAAAYSKAGQSDNVPVDYTLRKNVWKAKGAPAGAVHFTQQKTVYVTPSRRPDE
jgi:predicted ribosome quality control (RQC) complex YloA/Tae2 family protein